MKYQVTILSASGYKPISTVVETNAASSISATKKIQARGIEAICAKRHWNSTDLRKYGYTKVKIRVYDLEKIKKENELRYWELKKKKFANGDWKPSAEDMKKILIENICK